MVGGAGYPKTPGTKTGRELNAPTTSRKWCPSPKPGQSAPVSVIDCIYRFDGTGSFTGTGGTWGTAKYIELYMLADDDEYSKAKTGICFVDLVEYDWTVTTRALDETPTAFSFTAVTDASPSTEYESDAITVLGIDATATPAITATDLEYSLNSGAYTSTAGTVELNDTVKVKLTSSGDPETPVSGTLTIGGVSATFTVTTAYFEPSSGFPFTLPFNLG